MTGRQTTTHNRRRHPLTNQTVSTIARLTRGYRRIRCDHCPNRAVLVLPHPHTREPATQLCNTCLETTP